MSSLAHELASAIDDVPGDSARSLAEEFGLEFGKPHRFQAELTGPDDSADDGLPTSSSTPSKIPGLDRRTPHSSSDVIPEWEEEESMFYDFDDFAQESSPPQRPFMSPRVERDPHVELEDALKLTGRVLEALRQVDTGRTTPPETILQKHLTNLLEVERTREEQLRELGVLERELGRVNWDEELLEGLKSLQWDDPGEPSVALQLRPVAEEEEPVKQQQALDAIDEMDADFDPAFADWNTPSSPTRLRKGTEQGSATRNAPDDIPSTLQSLQQSTTGLLTILHSLSDTLYLSSSMSVSSARQLKGIRAGVADWRQRDEDEINCLDKIEKYQAAEKQRQERGGERPAELAEREMREFKQALEGYERQWSTLKTLRV
jgi:hypothetical protein